MLQQFRMVGVTGGILRIFPFQLSVVPGQVGHLQPPSLCRPVGQLCLHLENRHFGINQTRAAILYFCIDWNSFSIAGSLSFSLSTQ